MPLFGLLDFFQKKIQNILYTVDSMYIPIYENITGRSLEGSVTNIRGAIG